MGELGNRNEFYKEKKERSVGGRDIQGGRIPGLPFLSRMVCSQDPESMQHTTFPLTKLCRTGDTGYVSRHHAPHGTMLWPGAGLF